MPILNYTTKIDAHKTVAEIQRILAKGGASSIKTDYENGFPVAISFLALIGDRLIPFKLPADFEGVQLALARDSGRLADVGSGVKVTKTPQEKVTT